MHKGQTMVRDRGNTVKKIGSSQPVISFKPLKIRRAFEEISGEIKQMIFSGALKSGDKLPPEVVLAEQFGVSRPTVREALRRLELSGFIRMQKGTAGGPVVVDSILQSIGNLFLDAYRVKKIRTEELTKARLGIEKVVLENVFEAKNRQGIARIRDAVTSAQNKFGQRSLSFEDMLLFHQRLAEATDNTVLAIVVEALLMTLVARFYSSSRTGAEQAVRNALEAHERIICAIEQGDEPTAWTELEKDILQIDSLYKSCTARRLR